jgi:hypothetical protein
MKSPTEKSEKIQSVSMTIQHNNNLMKSDCSVLLEVISQTSEDE